MKNFLTVDLEDWFHSISSIPISQWTQYEPRVDAGTAHLLSLFRARNVRATFFVLGAVAESNPDLVRRIVDEGHEVASHGDAHRLVYNQTQAEFEADLERSLQVLGRLSPEPVLGYRAPWWSITEKSLWALDSIRKAGLLYDSSIYPARTGYYGIAGATPTIHQRKTANGTLTEIPPLTKRVLGRALPAGGGFFIRTFPLSFNKKAVRIWNDRGHPAMVYIHPWEMDVGQPRLSLPIMQRLIHYTCLSKMEKKFERLLEEFEFGPIREVAAEYLAK